MPQPYRSLNNSITKLTNPRHRHNELRLRVMLKDFPPEHVRKILTSTWEEIFELATADEEMRKSLPVYDRAFTHFSKVEHFHLQLSELLQLRDEYKDQLDVEEAAQAQ